MLIVFDIDGTLAASPPVEDEDYAGWGRRIIAEPPLPVEGARDGVAALLAGSARPLLLTARGEHLYHATRDWLRVHLPALLGAPLSMRPRLDLRPAVLSKWDRLHTHRAVRSTVPAILVDDDEGMRIACGPGDAFLHAPSCWGRLGIVPSIRPADPGSES